MARLTCYFFRLEQYMYYQKLNGGTFFMKLNELLSEWMTVHREEEIKPQTIIRYECCINNYIKDSLGQEEIRNITKKAVQSYVEGLEADSWGKNRKGTLTSSVRCVLAVLKLAFDYAVENDLIPSNPAKRVFAPFGKEKKGAEASRWMSKRLSKVMCYLKEWMATTAFCFRFIPE